MLSRGLPSVVQSYHTVATRRRHQGRRGPTLHRASPTGLGTVRHTARGTKTRSPYHQWEVDHSDHSVLAVSTVIKVQVTSAFQYRYYHRIYNRA